jgi:YfiH family protein
LTLAAEALGLDPVVMVNQTHSAEIFYPDVFGPYNPKGPDDLVSGYDALVTKERKSLLIKLADCQGVLLFHPESEALALVHSGWRGSKQNILGRTVAFLKERLQVPPSELMAAVSPSLGPCCAEFIHYREELPQEFWAYRNPHNDHFDFWAITRNQLITAGLKPQNIDVAGICTKCHSEFFSYRRGDPGRFGFLAGVAA